MSTTDFFAVISPDVILVKDRKITISRIPPKSLLKVHKIIIANFKPGEKYDHSDFQTHITRLHSLNDMYAYGPDVEDVELFRSHITNFIRVWYNVTKNQDLAKSFKLKSVTAMEKHIKPDISKVYATLPVESQVDQTVQISNFGNLSLQSRCNREEDAASLKALKDRVEHLKKSLADCDKMGRGTEDEIKNKLDCFEDVKILET